MANKSQPKQNSKSALRNKRGTIILSLIIILIAIIPFLRPGVYTVQPADPIPDGTTIVYLFRPSGEPFFTSLDPGCVYSPTSVSLICNAMIRSKLEDLSGKILWRLPYNHWAYLKGTGGVEPGIYDDEY